MEVTNDDRLLIPLAKPAGKRPIKEKYYDSRIKSQLRSDEQRNGPISQANAHNRKNGLLFRLPAELRNVIYGLALTPNLHSALFYSDYCPRPRPESTPSVSIFCRSGNAYPNPALVLSSRDIYRETREMYTSIISQFYTETAWHLNSSGFMQDVSSSFETKFSIPRANQRKIDALNEENLKKINDLMIYDSRKDHGPQLLFKNGSWRGRWRAPASPDPDEFVVRHIILYEKSKRSTMKSLMRKYGQSNYGLLENGKCCQAGHPYKHHIEALIITPSRHVNDRVLEKFRDAAGLGLVTREVVEAMLYIQVYTRGRYS